MDKSWITKAKWSRDYVNGVNNFIEFASQSQNLLGKILCPCKSCINRYFHSMKDVKDHLISKGFFAGYVVWNRHGEEHCIIGECAMNEAFGATPKLKEGEALSESKFAFPGHVRHWILQSLGVKWRNHKINLKAEHWDSFPIEKILEYVPAGVDAAQWCQLVTQWSQPKDKERAAINAANAKKRTCPHTMGRVSSVRRQQEIDINDRLLLWRINKLRKDGTWSLEDAKQRWIQACELLAVDGLTPEDGNVEANERVFSMVMGPEHPDRVRTQGFGVTPTRYFPYSTNEGKSSGGKAI
ncbi:hypothetical protein M5K25_023674 [Dendrobium thyrsiflorum]|uniref:Transposase-associated domain-containing protein n=1 Tax=Dendrobium thyrsiflorum TaxID=117978 RepID=A0ABD0UFI2_DENTH